MPTCRSCNADFPSHIHIDGERKCLYTRKFCLNCSPYKDRSKNLRVSEDDDVTRRCTVCEHWLPQSEFYRTTNKKGESKVQSRCKTCFGKMCSDRQKDCKRLNVEYKGGKCEKCGYDRCIDALEFHHVDPSQKDPKIRFGSSRASFSKIKAELDKCILLCANCHREEHARLRSY